MLLFVFAVGMRRNANIFVDIRREDPIQLVLFGRVQTACLRRVLTQSNPERRGHICAIEIFGQIRGMVFVRKVEWHVCDVRAIVQPSHVERLFVDIDPEMIDAEQTVEFNPFWYQCSTVVPLEHGTRAYFES